MRNGEMLPAFEEVLDPMTSAETNDHIRRMLEKEKIIVLMEKYKKRFPVEINDNYFSKGYAMKHLKSVGWACVMSLSILVYTQNLFSRVVDRTVALVNGEPVLQTELDKNTSALQEMQEKLKVDKKLTDKERIAQRKEILDQMIDDKLMLQEAKKKKIRVNRRDVEKGILQVKERFKRDQKGNAVSEDEAEEAFRQELKKEGITRKEFEDRIEDQVSVINLIDQEVKAKVPQPSEKEIEQMFGQLQQLMKDKTPAGMTAEEEKDLKIIAKYFEDSIAERVRCRHILVRVDAKATFTDKNKARRKITGINKRLKSGADFAQLAREYSDDTESAKNGGDLGFFVKGWMVPAFEKAAFNLRVGELSDIIETEFGYHVIRCEEKKAAGSLELSTVHDELAAYIFQQKAKKKFETWIKDLRAKANIQIKDKTLQ